jgi:hypothetical protein
MTDEDEKQSLWRKRAISKEKTEQGRAVNLRLTQSEYAEYVRLGGVKWMRMLLRLSSGIQSQERNFCSRCGKRTADLTTIHTCTPPRD